MQSIYLAKISCELTKKMKEEKKNTKNYYKFIISKTNKDNTYELEKWINYIASTYDRKGTLISYMQDYFFKIKKFIDKLFNNLITNFHIFPYSIKCACKLYCN